jgi:ribonuclease VapC
MIAVDTSALMAIILDEPAADVCQAVLETNKDVLMSAGTMTEAMVVAAGRKVSPRMIRLIADFGFEIIPVTAASARRIGDIYARWGKGIHPAGLNFGDCFAYDVAKEHACPLLFVGGDFAKTDVLRVVSDT